MRTLTPTKALTSSTTYSGTDTDDDWMSGLDLPFPERTKSAIDILESRTQDDTASRFVGQVHLLFGGRAETTATAAEVVVEARPGVHTAMLDEVKFLIRVTRDELTGVDFSAMVAVPRVRTRNVIADRLEEARDVLGVTMEEIADAALVSRSSLFAWANSSTRPRPSSRRELDQLFAVTGAAVQAFGRTGARDWFAAGSPSRGQRLMTAGIDEVARELEHLVNRPDRSQRPAQRVHDEEPTPLDGNLS